MCRSCCILDWGRLGLRMFEKPLAASVSCVKNIMTPQLIAIREKKKEKKKGVQLKENWCNFSGAPTGGNASSRGVKGRGGGEGGWLRQQEERDAP